MEIGGTSTWIPSFCGLALGCTGGIWHWDALAVQRYLAEHSDTLSPLNPPRHTLAPVCVSSSASCCYNLTSTHTCKVQGGFYVASMQCWAQLHTCIVASSTQVGCRFIQGNAILEDCPPHKYRALLSSYSQKHVDIWLVGFWWYFLQKYGQLINGCAIGGLQKCKNVGAVSKTCSGLLPCIHFVEQSLSSVSSKSE